MVHVGITAESHGDATFVAAVGDRVMVEAADWMDGQLPDMRVWRGLGHEPFLNIHAASRLAAERGLHRYGDFKDGPGKLDAKLYWRVLALFADEADEDTPAVVVVSSDTDEDDERLEGFRQAKAEARWPFTPVLAGAHPEHEAWLLAAFVPEDDAERALLASVRAELGFDPTVHADELKAGDEAAKRNAKRILRLLCDHAEARERLLALHLDTLRDRGVPSRLTAFLTDFRAAIAPHLGAGPA